MTAFWIVVEALVYAAASVATFGAALADMQRRYPTIAHEGYRRDVAFSVFMALTPVGWVVCLFFSRFYEFGFQFDRKSRLR